MHRRRVLDKAITYIGLDVQKDTIAVPHALDDRRVLIPLQHQGGLASPVIKGEGSRRRRLALPMTIRSSAFMTYLSPSPSCSAPRQRCLTRACHGCLSVL